jgi:hypothetical protein
VLAKCQREVTVFKLARFLSRALPLLIAVALMPQPVPAAAWASTPSLDGESFSGTATLNTTSCPTTDTGTLGFTANGSASGPYSGTFTESGTITFSGLVNVTDFNATFTLTSSTGNVLDGRKFGSLTPVFGVCLFETSPPTVTSNYTATITLPTGEQFCDTGGTAQTTITVSPLGATTFTEQFSNSNTTLTTHPPC